MTTLQMMEICIPLWLIASASMYNKNTRISLLYSLIAAFLSMFTFLCEVTKFIQNKGL